MRTLIAKLLILLMSLHILVPAGFMLGRSADGASGPTIVICHGDVFGVLRIAPTGSDTDPSQEHGPQSLCPYAAFGALALDATTPKPVVRPVTYQAVEFPAPVALHVVATKWWRPSARAPPFAA